LFIHEYGHTPIEKGILWDNYRWPTAMEFEYGTPPDHHALSHNFNVMTFDATAGKDGDNAYKPIQFPFSIWLGEDSKSFCDNF